MGRPLFCTHAETTPADEDGVGVCVSCGALVQLRLTAQLLNETVERVRRDFGRWHHSMRCVETPDGWCCADDCTL